MIKLIAIAVIMVLVITDIVLITLCIAMEKKRECKDGRSSSNNLSDSDNGYPRQILINDIGHRGQNKEKEFCQCKKKSN